MDSTVGGPAFSASQQVADMVNAVRFHRCPAACGRAGAPQASCPFLNLLTHSPRPAGATLPGRHVQVVEGTAASLDAYHSFLAQHLPPSEVAPDALAQVRSRLSLPLSCVSPPRDARRAHTQGLDNTSQRIAVHADACLSRFEQWALESVFARPAALDEHAAQQAAASTAFTREEESELDARLQAARCRLAAVRVYKPVRLFLSSDFPHPHPRTRRTRAQRRCGVSARPWTQS
jgi:hypothetical protein